MGWIVLVGGLALWIAGHLAKRRAPEFRAILGRGGITVVIVLSVLWMIFGYRWAPFVPVWTPPVFFTYANNILMLLAFYMYMSAMAAPGLWIARIKHPQLTAFKIWAFAHLLVNGDLASILLWGGLLAWAVLTVILIKKEDGAWERPPTAPIKSEVLMASVGVAAFAVVSGLHVLAGVNPFGG